MEEIVGLHPHFTGQGSMRASLVKVINRPGENSLDGGFYAWCQPIAREDPKSGEYPFVFDTPDIGVHASLVLPCIATVQLAAFAYELAAFADDTAFDKAQTHEPRFAPESFIPTGLFTSSPAIAPTAVPTAHAIAAGHVRRAERRSNVFTGKEFWWLVVQTLGGTIDVIADPGTVVGSPQLGGVVQGTFWLSGRIQNVSPEA
jgi:hypothetical protein